MGAGGETSKLDSEGYYDQVTVTVKCPSRCSHCRSVEGRGLFLTRHSKQGAGGDTAKNPRGIDMESRVPSKRQRRDRARDKGGTNSCCALGIAAHPHERVGHGRRWETPR